MKYTCANCDTLFETDDPKPRCPQCLRRHGLLEVGADAEEKSGKPGGDTSGKPGGDRIGEEKPRDVSDSASGALTKRRGLILGALAALVVIGVGVGVYLIVKKKPADKVPSKVGLGQVDPALLKKVAEGRGVPLQTIHFAPDEAILAAGKRLAGGGDVTQVAKAVLGVVRQGLAEGDKGVTAEGKKPWVDLRPPGRFKAGPLLGAPALFSAIGDGRQVTVVSYELACLTLALARAAGLAAVMTEIYHHTDRQGPADPSGFQGYFGVAIYGSSRFEGEPALVLDPARGTLGTAREFEVLTDLRAAAHGLSLHAFGLLRGTQELAAANEASEQAVKLEPGSATLMAGRGMLLLSAGGMEPAMDAFRLALNLRDDAPRHLLLGLGTAQRTQSPIEAAALVEQALNKDPDYALAHAFKAQFLLQQGKGPEAMAALDRAQELVPHLPEALVLRAQFLLAEGKPTQALALLRSAVERDPQSHEARLALWQVLTVLGEEEKAEAEEKALVELVPPAQQGKTRQMLEELKKELKERRASVAPPTGPGAPQGPAPGGGDPYKLTPPSGTEPGFGKPSTPFDAPSGTEPMLQL